MENSQLKKDALQNLQATDLREFSIDNDEINVLSGWTYIAMFLIEARTSLKISESHNKKDRFSEIEDVILAHGMFKNFVLSYTKCFSSAGKQKISLDAEEIFSSRPDLKVMHGNIVNIRNNYVAHNGDNDYEISISATHQDDYKILLAHTYTIMTPLSDYNVFKETIDYCEEQVALKLNKKIDKIQGRIGKIISFK